MRIYVVIIMLCSMAGCDAKEIRQSELERMSKVATSTIENDLEKKLTAPKCEINTATFHREGDKYVSYMECTWRGAETPIRKKIKIFRREDGRLMWSTME